MLAYNVTDRRLNPSGKNLNNRQRFLERIRKKIENSVTKGLGKRGIEDQGEAEVSISREGIDEPSFQYERGKGVWDYLLPGNKEYIDGDAIGRPPEGGGSGSEGAPDGEGEDDFRFYVSYEEYINAIFGDLSLPDMVKESEKHTIQFKFTRAGYTPVGAASNLALERTMIQGISRRQALKTPKLLRIQELEDELDDTEEDEHRVELEDEIAELLARAKAIPFLDKSDLRYHNTVKVTTPISSAVMFAVMDVSGSMTEHMKDLAKRFYILLYLFLKRQYKDVAVVFIRHTHEAFEVDEDTFFHSQESGGTVVSTAYDEMARIIAARYPVSEWNIYCAQASDGDNTGSDTPVAHNKLVAMMPWLQYFTYVEVGREADHFPQGFVRRDSDVWQMMEQMLKTYSHKMAIRRISNKNEVVEIFRSLFKKRQETA